jgi:hypothetical protein
MPDREEIETTPAWDETQPIPLDVAGRPVDADGIPLFGPGRAKALAEIAGREAAEKAAAEKGAAAQRAAAEKAAQQKKDA